MKFEEYKSKVEDVLKNLDNQATVSTILSELTEVYQKEQAEKNDIIAKNEKLLKDNENLRQANMQLFLKVGKEVTTEKEGVNENKEEKPSFESLFDEDGNLL